MSVDDRVRIAVAQWRCGSRPSGFSQLMHMGGRRLAARASRRWGRGDGAGRAGRQHNAAARGLGRGPEAKAKAEAEAQMEKIARMPGAPRGGDGGGGSAIILRLRYYCYTRGGGACCI